MRIYLLVGLLLAASGCAGTVPRETAVLSATARRQTAEAKRSHLKIVNMWADSAKAKEDALLEYSVYPTTVKNFLKLAKFDKIVCDNEGELDRAVEMQKIIQALSRKFRKQRRERMKPISKLERKILDRIQALYAQLELIQSSISSNLKSVVKGQEIQGEILKALDLPEDPIAETMEALQSVGGDRVLREIHGAVK